MADSSVAAEGQAREPAPTDDNPPAPPAVTEPDDVVGEALTEEAAGGDAPSTTGATFAVTHVVDPFVATERKLFVPLPPPPPPKPKPIITPERTEKGFRTAGISIDRGAGHSAYVSIRPVQGGAQTIYVCAPALKTLLDLAAAPGAEPGKLWKALCDIPIERPLPNRHLEEELRVLLTRFASELR